MTTGRHDLVLYPWVRSLLLSLLLIPEIGITKWCTWGVLYLTPWLPRFFPMEDPTIIHQEGLVGWWWITQLGWWHLKRLATFSALSEVPPQWLLEIAPNVATPWVAFSSASFYVGHSFSHPWLLSPVTPCSGPRPAFGVSCTAPHGWIAGLGKQRYCCVTRYDHSSAASWLNQDRCTQPCCWISQHHWCWIGDSS